MAEGVGTAPAVLELARRFGTDMPIAETVGAVLDGRLIPADAVAKLMHRDPAAELHDLAAGYPMTAGKNEMPHSSTRSSMPGSSKTRSSRES